MIPGSCSTAPVVTVRADDDVELAYHAMRRAGVRRIPVLAGMRLTGTVTMDDLRGCAAR